MATNDPQTPFRLHSIGVDNFHMRVNEIYYLRRVYVEKE